jgi:hypothetical protein
MRSPFVLVSLLVVPMTAAGAADYTLSGGMDYSTGKYGSSQSTEIAYFPLIGKLESGASTFKLTVPYLRIRSASGGNLIGVDAQGSPIYDGNGPKQTEEGLGDLVASYTYSVIARPIHGFLLDLTGKVKLATADDRKGLGTGKNDYTVLTDLYYLAGAWTPFTTLSYRFTGNPAGSSLRNVWGTTLGLAYKRNPENSYGAMWDLRQASRSGGTGTDEMTVYWVSKFAAGYKLQSYVVKGFSSGSADWGVGLVLAKVFGN